MPDGWTFGEVHPKPDVQIHDDPNVKENIQVNIGLFQIFFCLYILRLYFLK